VCYGGNTFFVRSPRYIARPAKQYECECQQHLNLYARGEMARDPKPCNKREECYGGQFDGELDSAFQRDVVAPGKQRRYCQCEQD
jgi:hypothetical protein